jgi:CBS domain-containing protein
MIRAHDIMSSPVITATTMRPVTETAALLREHQISGCPVLDHRGQLVGVISRADILDYALSVEGGALTPMLRTLVATGEEVEEEEVYAPIDDSFEVPQTQDVMSPEPVTVDEQASVGEVARIMSEERVHRVVVTRDGRLAGIITSLDLVKVLARIASRHGS